MTRRSQDAQGFHRCPRHTPAVAYSNAVAALAAAGALSFSLVVTLAIISFEVLRTAPATGLL